MTADREQAKRDRLADVAGVQLTPEPATGWFEVRARRAWVENGWPRWAGLVRFGADGIGRRTVAFHVPGTARAAVVALS